MTKNFDFAEFDREQQQRAECRNLDGRWVECVGGIRHAKEVAERDGTAFRVVNTTVEYWTYEGRD